MPARGKLIAGNWKMNGLSGDGAALAEALADRAGGSALPFEMLLCPPATLIGRVADIVRESGLAVGGQDCHATEKGAHTGDIAAVMLRDLGCTYVIVGHSERRQNHGETDEMVEAKAAAAHRAGLTAIICVGETEEERAGNRATSVVERQIQGSLPSSATDANTVVAYEPVWAIGTGKSATTTDVAEMHGFIRAALRDRVDSPESVRILYGGSVKASNARELLAIADVDGALVGGASLIADEFWAIGQSCP